MGKKSTHCLRTEVFALSRHKLNRNDLYEAIYWNYCKKLNSLKHLVRTTVAELHN